MIDRYPALRVVADPAALARAVAEHVVACGMRAVATRGRFDLVLAGGSTPAATYALLADVYAGALDWSRVRFWFGDERCVPPTDDASNFKLAKRTLFEPLGISESRIHRMRGEIEPAVAAERYAHELTDELGTAPKLDAIMLGMGSDGHTASLFPGEDPFVDTGALVRAVYVEKLAGYRLTLTPTVIDGADSVAVAASGTSKAAALHALFDGRPEKTKMPISVIGTGSASVMWFVDEAAARLLERPAP